MLNTCQTMLEEVDTNLLTSQQKMLWGHCKQTLGIFQMFSPEASRAEVTITEAVTMGRLPHGPMVPLPGSLPPGQSNPPPTGSTKKGKKHMNIVVKSSVH